MSWPPPPPGGRPRPPPPPPPPLNNHQQQQQQQQQRFPAPSRPPPPLAAVATTTTTGGGGFRPPPPRPQPPPPAAPFSAPPRFPPPPTPTATLTNTTNKGSSTRSFAHPPPPPPPVGGMRRPGPPPIRMTMAAPPTPTPTAPPPSSYPSHAASHAASHHAFSYAQRPSQPPQPPPPVVAPSLYPGRMAQMPPPTTHHPPQPPQHSPGYPAAYPAAAAAPPSLAYPPQQQPPPSQQPQPPSMTSLPRPDPPTRPHAILDTYYPKGHFVHGNTNGTTNLPPVTGRAVILDDGNASPHLLSSSMYAIPMDSNMLRQVLGKQNDIISLSVTPLGLPSQEHLALLPKTNSSCHHSSQHYLPESGRLGYVALTMDYKDNDKASTTTTTTIPDRCRSCQAYPNAGMIQDGICNLCGSKSPGLRRTNVGSIDIPVSGPYITRSRPVAPHFVFALDLTLPNFTQLLHLVLHQVLPIYAQQADLYATAANATNSNRPPTQTARVGIVLVSSLGIHLPTTNHTQFVVMPDVTEQPFCPLPLEEWTCELSMAAVSKFQQLWQEDGTTTTNTSSLPVKALIHQVQQAQRYQYSCGGAAWKFLLDALEASGGRGTWISWRRPNHGVGHLTTDRLKKIQSAADYTAREHLLYTSSSSSAKSSTFYTSLAQQAAQSHVALDMILVTDPAVPKSFLELATLQQVCDTTNGRLTWISTSGGGVNWQRALQETLTRPVVQFCGWDAILKVRVSKGLLVKRLESSVGVVRPAAGITDDSPELELAVVTPDTTVGIHLQHRVGGLPKNSTFCHVQSALLYTNPWNGQRRVRVSTLALRVATTAAQVFGAMDGATLTATLLRQTVQMVRSGGSGSGGTTEASSTIQAARQYVKETCQTILTNYRKHGASLNSRAISNSSSSQLLLPDKLKVLPLFCLSLLKSPLLRPSIQARNSNAARGGGGGAMMIPAPNPSADERAHALYHASHASPTMALWHVFPWIIDLEASACRRWNRPGKSLPDDAHPLDLLKHAPYLSVPEPILPSMAELQDDHSYLLVTPLKFHVVIGKDVGPAAIQEIERVVAEESYDDDNDEDHSTGANLQRLLKQVRVWSQVGREPRWLRPTWDTVELARPEQVASWFVADPTRWEPDYANYLQGLQQYVLKETGK